MRGLLHHRDYGWREAEVELAMGVAPAVVAARLGEPEDYVLEIADRQGWPVTWSGPSERDRFIADQWLDS